MGVVVLGCLGLDPFRAPLTTTFADYLIPRSTDVPSILVEHLESWRRDHRSASRRSRKGRPRGTPAAIICAVLGAISPHGAAIESLPVTPAMIMDTLDRPAQP